MSREIVIDPVTRIEGHSKITIQLDDAGEVKDALFHVTQLRGFEKFAEGRPFHEMPSLMSRICGICPVSHLVASAKACDDILSVRIPPTAVNLRRVMNLAQIAQSHALLAFGIALVGRFSVLFARALKLSLVPLGHGLFGHRVLLMSPRWHRPSPRIGPATIRPHPALAANTRRRTRHSPCTERG